MADYLNIAATIILSLGGSGAIILGLSNYLGKVWANRVLERERFKNSKLVEELRSSLRKENDEYLANITNQIEIYKQTHLREHSDKLAIYRAAIDLVSSMLAKIEMVYLKNKEKLTPEECEQFEIERLRIYGYLAMLAPQDVMDANDHLTDLLLALIYDGESTSWLEVRSRALVLTNAMRKDIGLDKSDVNYNGAR
ncbi:hypothetical protein ACUT8K_004643 [Vibrio parahaemolyticus]|uniref:hypothetical protein n=1 Tax=Vibrio parahaemolyticus TaxID=670 RepID=UPI00046EC50A|nr:hypothetical protein [Vibrio parahaemolyticus]KIT42112.1 hypothetical protein H331_23050 [Vibrio parahaemolyticus 3644]KIT55720.1 hypothetical protein H336_22465 [Vibrio parahaemolyticus EN9701072]EGQ8244527.1 hypothetical protein [Vibrio parahaemolyticus]EGQ9455268.1 hypothetical protein [Vibrio parahaemolyticus]EGQ9547048.1 hypothetical protein [Vibrio parahaemolyticus]